MKVSPRIPTRITRERGVKAKLAKVKGKLLFSFLVQPEFPKDIE